MDCKKTYLNSKILGRRGTHSKLYSDLQREPLISHILKRQRRSVFNVTWKENAHTYSISQLLFDEETQDFKRGFKPQRGGDNQDTLQSGWVGPLKQHQHHQDSLHWKQGKVCVCVGGWWAGWGGWGGRGEQGLNTVHIHTHTWKVRKPDTGFNWGRSIVKTGTQRLLTLFERRKS